MRKLWAATLSVVMLGVGLGAAGPLFAEERLSILVFDFNVEGVRQDDFTWLGLSTSSASWVAARIKQAHPDWNLRTVRDFEAYLKEAETMERLGCAKGEELKCFIETRGVSDLLTGELRKIGDESFEVFITWTDKLGRDRGRVADTVSGSRQDVQFGIEQLVDRLFSDEEGVSPREGVLKIACRPSGAFMLVDDGAWKMDLTRSSHKLKLPSGAHRIEIRLKDHEPYLKLVDVRPGKVTKLDVTLRQRPGLEVRCVPGGEITLDDRPVGESPRLLAGLESRTYLVHCRKDGFMSAWKKVKLEPGETGKVVVQLAEIPRVRVECSAPGSVVTLDERVRKDAPATFMVSRAGRHSVTCVASGYETESESFDVEGGEVLDLRLRMDREVYRPVHTYWGKHQLRFGYGYHLFPRASLDADSDYEDLTYTDDGYTSTWLTDLVLEDIRGPVNPSAISFNYMNILGDVGWTVGTTLIFAGNESVNATVRSLEFEEDFPGLSDGIPATITDLICWEVAGEFVYQLRWWRFNVNLQAGLGTTLTAIGVNFYTGGHDQDVTMYEFDVNLPFRGGLDFYLSEGLLLHANYTYYPLYASRRAANFGLGLVL